MANVRNYRTGRKRNEGVSYTVDHFIPRILGGVSHYTNYVLACYKCNSIKKKCFPPTFTQRRKHKRLQEKLIISIEKFLTEKERKRKERDKRRCKEAQRKRKNNRYARRRNKKHLQQVEQAKAA